MQVKLIGRGVVIILEQVVAQRMLKADPSLRLASVLDEVIRVRRNAAGKVIKVLS